MERTLFLAVVLALAALGTAAETVPQLIDGDALTHRILAEATRPPITAVRIRSGEVIAFRLAPPASAPNARLKPAKGLAAAAGKKSSKKRGRRALAPQQLKHVDATRNWVDKR